MSHNATQTSRSRILFLNHTAAMGGAEFALLRLVRGLDKRKFDVTVVLFAAGPLVKQLAEAGVSVHVLTLPAEVVETSRHAALGALLRFKDVAITLKFVSRLAAFMRKGRFNLVHTNSLKADLIGGLAAFIARKRVIWHVHIRVASDYMPAPVVHAYRALAHTFPTFLIANSQSTLTTLLPFPLRRCRVVYPGVSIPDDLPPAEALTRCDPAAGALVGLVGRVSSTKGQDIFLRAAAEVLKRFPKTRFQIIGSAFVNDRPFEEEMHKLAETLGLNGAVEFTGFVHDVEKRIASLDLLVHASTTPEPFGQVVVEGMLAGKPVIATNAGGVPEIVEDGETGILVPVRDSAKLAAAICRVFDDPDEALRMARRGRDRAINRFTIEHTVRDVEEIYDGLLKD